MKPETLGRDAILTTLAMVMLTLVLASISTFIPITSAEVTELNVNPQVVNPCDVITISGKATMSGEEVWIGSSFELPLDVEAGEYSRDFNGINFPKGEKTFSVTAENIKNISVSLSPVLWGQTVTITCSGQTMTVTAFGITKTEPLEESIDETGVAMFSILFPVTFGPVTFDISGKKNVKVEGGAAEGATSVNLKVTSSIKVTSDANGDFPKEGPLELNTEGVPEGEFLISAKGTDGEKKEETVYIGVTPTPTPTPSPSPSPSPTPTPTSSSSNGSDGNGAPDTTLSPTPSPSPTLSPSPTPTSTSTPMATLAPTATPASQAPTPVTPTPSPSPSPNSSQRGIPGFEAVFAIAGLLAVVYLVRKKREKK